ncbi:MAG: hypothetical protein ABMA15_14035 [Vicinamibacterales bacterium]
MIWWHTGITFGRMETVTLKLDRRHIQRLKDHAAASGRSQAAVVRDLIDRHLGGRTRSLHDQAKDLCGVINGSKDTSTRSLKGYGGD